jgi:hypothetical protein
MSDSCGQSGCSDVFPRPSTAQKDHKKTIESVYFILELKRQGFLHYIDRENYYIQKCHSEHEY